MPRLASSFSLYIKCTCLYGLLHAIPQCWSYKSRVYTYEPKELLLVDKAAVVIGMTVSAPVLWPLLLRRDLIRLECLARGKPAGEYLPANDDA